MRAALALALAAAAFAAATGPVLAETREYDLPAFHAIDIATGLNAVVTVGGEQSVSVESERSEPFDKLELDVENGTLRARFEADFFDFIMSGGLLGLLVNGRPDVTVHITMPKLDRIEASSGADVAASGMSGDTLKANASSGADIDLADVTVGSFSASVSSGASFAAAGSCETVDADVSSGGDLDLADLVCKSVTANASSGGDMDVHALESIRANASSGGDIGISGNPAQTDFNSSSGGDIDLDD
ncbi:head GIN domain-containing protein [Devosia nitrariae]|uniref:Putative auto-transporter adhesin head GIN domain-containing protein n=1 Tax=Devosia nitrariae TaxID=2071872 RepID=A0ABQ5WC21_9HYPH|nr:head GIN domain-containing protein [Devosia nitrariae]GLQ57367.1 hypothetical protein GCM10010862_46260 [Devosia nitrariae]